jgi:hypothetical protein
MNKNIADSLNATFGVVPTSEEEPPWDTTTSVTPQVKSVVPSQVKSVTTPKLPKKLHPDAYNEQNIKERQGDLKTSRTAIEKVLQTGTDAIDNLYSLAIDSEEARNYEVLADMIDKIGNTAEKLMKLRREEAEINRIEAKIEQDKNAGDTSGPKSVTTNNTIFVGDAKELLKHIKGAKNATIEGAVEVVK